MRFFVVCSEIVKGVVRRASMAQHFFPVSGNQRFPRFCEENRGRGLPEDAVFPAGLAWELLLPPDPALVLPAAGFA